MKVYHYTTGVKLKLIRESCELIPTNIGIRRGEKPVLWFSAHPRLEPTARKLLMRNRDSVLLELDDYRRFTEGAYRFQVDSDRLIPWSLLKHRAGMTMTAAKKLAKEGKRQKAKASDWYGSLEPIDLGEIELLERWDVTAQAWRVVEII